MHGKEHKPALLWKRVDCCHCVSVHKSNISLFCARYCAVFFIWSPFAEIALRWRWSSGFGHVLCYLRLKRLRLSALSKPTTEITGNRFHSFNDAGGSGATVNASASACSLPSVVRSSVRENPANCCAPQHPKKNSQVSTGFCYPNIQCCIISIADFCRESAKQLHANVNHCPFLLPWLTVFRRQCYDTPCLRKMCEI